MAALDTFYSLACPPKYHQCIDFNGRHSTALHKVSMLCHPIYEIVDAANLMGKVPVEDLCSGRLGSFASELAVLNFDYLNRLLVSKALASDPTDLGVLADKAILTLDLSRDTRSIHEIIVHYAVPQRYRLSLQWHIRIRRYFLSPDPSTCLLGLHVQASASAILLCCHLSSASLAHFFHDKTDFFRAFVALLRTGVGQTDYCATVPIALRLIANQCLTAIVGSKEASVSILSRFSWLQHDLGLNRAQYMGLLPCLLRFLFANLLAVDESSVAGGTIGMEEFLEWTESVLSLLLAVLSVPVFLTAFIDNGMISLMLSVFKRRSTLPQSRNRHKIEALTAQILDLAMTSNSHALAVFKDSNGIDIVVDKLVYELETHLEDTEVDVIRVKWAEPLVVRASTRKRKAPSIALSQRKRAKKEKDPEEEEKPAKLETAALRCLVHGLLTVLSACMHEGYSDGSDNRLSQLIRNSRFATIFKLIFSNASGMTAPLLAAACSVLGEAINNDPSPPSVLSCMITSGVVDYALKGLNSEHIFHTGDSMLSAANLWSSVSLSEEGIAAVRAADPFRSILTPLVHKQYVTPVSRVLMGDLAGLLGSNLEELIRHHPVHMEPVLLSIIEQMSVITDINESRPGVSLEDNDGVYLQHVQFSVNVLSCLEPLLARKQTAVSFIELDGVTHLTELIRIGLGPPKYLLTALSCSIDPTTSSVGIHPVIKQVLRCLQRLAEHSSGDVVASLFKLIGRHKDLLRKSLDDYWMAHGSAAEEAAGAEGMGEGPQGLLSPAGKKSKAKDKKSKAKDEPFARMHLFLDTASSVQLYDTCVGGALSPQVLDYTHVLETMMFMDYLIEALAAALSWSLTTTGKAFDVDKLNKKASTTLIAALVSDIYVGSQAELCRSRSSLTVAKDTDEIRHHPIYRLLVVAHDSVVVKNSADDSSKKVYRLDRGSIVDAFERVSTSSSILKYRVEGGWVSYIRSVSSAEPQIQVIDVRPKSAEMKESERRDNSSLDTPQKVFDVEKYANMSARRGGFMAIFHFHSCMRRLLQCLSKTMVSSLLETRQLEQSKKDKVYKYVHTYLELILSSLNSLLPESDMNFQTETDLYHGIANLPIDFVVYSIPDVADFGIAQTFRTIHIVELCSSVLFDEKPISRGDRCNTLLLAHMYSSGTLENIMKVTANCFLVCLNPRNAFEFENTEPESSLTIDRRILAISNIDNVVDFWRQLLNSTGSAVEGDVTAKTLQAIADDEHDFDVHCLRRQVFILVARYVYQCWAHPYLHTLPPTTVRSILDIMHISIKNVIEVRGYADRYMLSSSMRNRGSGSGASDLTWSEDLGHMNLTEGLSRAARDIFRGSSGRRLSSADSLPFPPFPVDVGGMVAADSSSASAGVKQSKVKSILPLVPFMTAEDIKKQKDAILAVQKQMFRSVHPTSLLLLVKGVRNTGVHWSSEAAATNQSITRELTTIMILNQLNKCYDVLAWVPSTLQFIHLAWLYREAIEILTVGDISGRRSSALYGLLHAIVLLLTGKVMTNSKNRRVVNNETLIMIFSRDSKFAAMFDLLLVNIDKDLQAVTESTDLTQLEWITPALLLLEVFSSSYLIDKSDVRSTLVELEKLLKAKKSDHDRLLSVEAISSLSEEYSVRDVSTVVFDLTRQSDENEADFIAVISPEPLRGPSGGEPLLGEASTALDVLRESSPSRTILKDGGLQPSQKRQTLSLCMLVLEKCRKESPASNVLVHSCLQVLIHIITDAEIKNTFLASSGIKKLLQASTSFAGLSNLVFSIIQRAFEDTKCLTQVMEMAMKLGVARLSKQKTPLSQKDSAGPKVQLRLFLEALSPLIVRDQQVFLSVLEANMELVKVDKVVYIGLKAPAAAATTAEGPTAPKASDAGEPATPYDASARVRSVSGDSGLKAKGFFSSSKHNSDHGGHFFSHNVYSSLASIVLTICSQIAVVLEMLSEPIELPLRSFGSSSCLSLNDLFFVLADLVYCIPGLATFIHRFNIIKHDATFPLVSPCAHSTKHAISGKPVSPTRFLNFLVHNLVAYDAALDEFRKNPTVNAVKSDEVKRLVGPSLEDAAAYFLAALIARPGDGRRRALEELLDVLQTEGRLDTSHKIKATMAIAKTITALICPPPTWSAREIFVVPVKDNLILLASLNAHKVLANIMCCIDMDHPLGKEASLQVATCIELIIRKGIPLMQDSARSSDASRLAQRTDQAAVNADEQLSATPIGPASERYGLATPSNAASAPMSDMTNGRPIESMDPPEVSASVMQMSDDDEVINDDDDDSDDISGEDDHRDGEHGEESEEDAYSDSDNDDDDGLDEEGEGLDEEEGSDDDDGEEEDDEDEDDDGRDEEHDGQGIAVLDSGDQHVHGHDAEDSVDDGAVDEEDEFVDDDDDGDDGGREFGEDGEHDDDEDQEGSDDPGYEGFEDDEGVGYEEDMDLEDSYGGEDAYDPADESAGFNEGRHGHMVDQVAAESDDGHDDARFGGRISATRVERDAADDFDYTGGYSVSRHRRNEIMNQYRSIRVDNMNTPRVFVNAEGGMRIRLGTSSGGGIMEFFGQLPASLTANGNVSSVSIVNSDGVVLASEQTNRVDRGDTRSRMQQLVSSMTSINPPRRSDFVNPNVCEHPLLNVNAEIRRTRAVPIRRPGFALQGSGVNIDNIIQLSDDRERESFAGGHPISRGSRRNTLGPLLSDRRWGMGIGIEADVNESRLPVLLAAVEDLFKNSIEVPKDVEGRKKPTEREIFNKALRGGAVPEDFSGSGEVFVDPDEPEESKEEGELQEYKEGEEELLGATRVSGEAPLVDAAVPEGSLDDVSNARESLVTERAVAASLSDDDFDDDPGHDGPGGDADDQDDEDEGEDEDDENVDEVDDVPPLSHGCPPGYDPEVWASLPPELQAEALAVAQSDVASPPIGSTDLDREVLALLPLDIRSEVLHFEEAERVRSASVASLSEPGPNASIATAAANDNLMFVTSLSSDLRREVLLSVDDAFIASLPSAMQSEAHRLRRSAGFSGMQNYLPELGLEAVGRPRTGGSAFERMRDRLNQARSGASDPAAAAATAEFTRVVSTQMSIADDRFDAVLPFSGALLWRLFRHLGVGHRSRCPRPIMRLLSCMCRYAGARKWLLGALSGLLLRDLNCVEQSLNQVRSESSDTVALDLAAMADFFSPQSTDSHDFVALRRLLSAVSYFNRKVPRLVWLDIMRSSSDSNGSVQPVWLFGILIQIIGKVTDVPGFESGVDLVLHIIEELCEPLAKLTTTQVSALIERSTQTPPVDETETSRFVVPLPFPLLQTEHFVALAKAVKTTAPRASSTKLLLRILKTLVLSRQNWLGLLTHLTEVARLLVSKCALEVESIFSELSRGLSLQQDTFGVAALPIFSQPSNNSEVTLFQVIQYIKTMRTELSPEDVATIALHISSIDFGNIWTRLNESLEVVRQIEGLTDIAVDAPMGYGELAVSSSSTTELPTMVRAASLSSSTSSLIMRFMPLIQSFLTVCDSIVLRAPEQIADNLDGSESVLRKRSRDEADPTDVSLIHASEKLVKPGAKFRLHAEFLKMQMDLTESHLSEQLVSFVEKNAMLLNMLLNQNISLFDAAFRPLICVPRLRHQLHFDLKREYFRLKLKKLRHAAVRMHGPLRLSVRRDRVFEDSLAFFESLKTSDALRRKLSISFQGEDGVDAGGLTREWYTVLAREMFNPNYALFTATSDGVTFQPNTNSAVVHTFHLIYFKFVGRIIGKAICDGQLLDAHFTRSFYKHILGISVSYHDLEAIEPDYYKSLKQILELPLELLGLDLTFSTEQDEFGRMVVKPLIENGQNIAVTDENKALYVQLVAHSRMTAAIEKQVCGIIACIMGGKYLSLTRAGVA